MNDQVLTSGPEDVRGRPGIEWKMANYRGFLGQNYFFAPNAPTGVMVDYFAKAAGPVRVDDHR